MKEENAAASVYRIGVGTAATTYPGLRPVSRVLSKGHVQREGAAALTCDVLFEQDVGVVLRDGTIIYVDVFRPVGDQPCPAIIGWGPYGKQHGLLTLDTFAHPTRMDVPLHLEDGLNMFEAVVPAYWVAKGYAIVSPDPRGVFSSEGRTHLWGDQEAADEYDLIEWAGTRPWSNGKVGLAGNSYLAMSQWFAASHAPPHLAAIAPWEGVSDLYRDTACRGGIPESVFSSTILNLLPCNREVELPFAALEEDPCLTPYWAEKAARLADISVPAYIVASWTNLIHTAGTIRGFEQISSPQKWLRVHNRHEWVDLYTPHNVEDLRRFFDRFLKGVDNGWEATPRVRLSVLDPGHEDLLDRAEADFPLARQKLVPFYLAAGGRLLQATPPCEAEVTYDALDAEGAKFRWTFDRMTEITGHAKVKLWVEARGNDDMDLFVVLRKIGTDGQVLRTQPVTGAVHEGPNGRLRVSMRRLDERRSKPELPWHAFDTVEKLSPGEVVPVEVDIWPMSMLWHEGESLEVVVNGVDLLVRPELPHLPGQPTLNQGRHALHVGGRYDAHVLLPMITAA